jgi:hypothetical protein
MAHDEPNYELNEFLLESVFDYSSKNPRDFTYIGIGSAPARIPVDTQDLSIFTPELDQLMPAFVLKEIATTSKTIRIIHIDSWTERFLPFLHIYFASFAQKGINFRHQNSEEMNIWTSYDNRIEVIFLFINIRHRRDYYGDPIDIWFLEKMIEVTLQNKKQLILMEYSGIDPIDVAKFLFNKSNQKDMFLKNILFDVSYGTAPCYCAIDMTKHFPMYKPDGTFYNFQLYNNQEMIDLIGTDDKINNILKIHFLKEYKFILDYHHQNYRRKFKGDTLAYQFPEYNESTSPDEIMKIIIDKINEYHQ